MQRLFVIISALIALTAVASAARSPIRIASSSAPPLKSNSNDFPVMESFTLVSIDAHPVNTYHFAASSMFNTWGGALSVESDTQAVVKLEDSDADVFFQAVSQDSERFCVIDGTLDLMSMDPRPLVYVQQGVYCEVKQVSTGVYNVSFAESDIDDCYWNGTACVQSYPGEQLVGSVTLMSNNYRIGNASSPATYGGDVLSMNQTYTLLGLWDSDGDVYLNVTSLDGSAYCSLDFGADPVRWDPYVQVMQMRNVVCTVSNPHYHQWEITMQPKPGYECNWNGWADQCQPLPPRAYQKHIPRL